MKRLGHLWTIGCLLFAASLALAQGQQPKIEFEIRTDKPEAVYHQGEEATFSVRLLQDGQPLAGQKITYQLTLDGVGTLGYGELTTQSEPLKVKGKLDKPGFLAMLAAFKTGPENKTVILGRGAAGYDPTQIGLSMPVPDDFDAFWAAEKAKVHAAAMEPKLTEVKSQIGHVLAYDLQLDCPGSERPVSAYLALPKDAKPKSLPIYLGLHGAGVRSSYRVDGWANQGFLAIDMNAHGIPNGQPESYYKELADGPLKGYPHFHSEDPMGTYFHGMYLRIIRAIQYLTSRPEWDGKVIVVQGSSQGGGQTVVAAGLEPRVTLAIARVPAMCDHTGILVDRISGWPKLLNQQTKTDANRVRTARLHDAVNFAQRAKARLIMTSGFIDTTTPPTSNYVMYNAWAGVSKDVMNMPLEGHVYAPADPQMKEKVESWIKKELDQAKTAAR